MDPQPFRSAARFGFPFDGTEISLGDSVYGDA